VISRTGIVEYGDEELRKKRRIFSETASRKNLPDHWWPWVLSGALFQVLSPSALQATAVVVFGLELRLLSPIWQIIRHQSRKKAYKSNKCLAPSKGLSHGTLMRSSFQQDSTTGRLRPVQLPDDAGNAGIHGRFCLRSWEI
jgi:hypothetical protein